MFKRPKKNPKLPKKLLTNHNIANKDKEYISEKSALSKKVEVNLSNLKNILGKSSDIIFKEFVLGDFQKTKAFICFINDWVDKKFLYEFILQPLTIDLYRIDDQGKVLSKDAFINLKERVRNIGEISEKKKLEEVINGILSGNVALYIDGYDMAFIIASINEVKRAIEEPSTETAIRGPREGFNENLSTNTALLRKKIKNENLIFESFIIGQETHTDVAICYIEGIADEKVVKEVKRRLKGINTSSIIESGYIEQFIEDHPYSLFSVVGNSERPDKIAAKVLEGRVAILCDGTPYVLTVPKLFIENIQTTEDYYSRPYLSSALRIFRLLSFFVTLVTPAVYLALINFHQEMIPTILLISIAEAREGIPFPAYLEIILIILGFELLRESGVRLPQQVGQAISIVGALIIGEAGGTGEAPIEHVSVSGDTIFEAIRKTTQKFDRRGYFPHTKVVVIAEELANEGIGPILDFFARSQELRRLMWLVIAKDTTALEVLGSHHGIEDIQGIHLNNIIAAGRLTSESSMIHLSDFIKRLLDNGIHPIAGVIAAPIPYYNLPSEDSGGGSTSPGLIYSGTAVFQKDRLVGYLDSIETRGLNWVIGEIQSGIINVP